MLKYFIIDDCSKSKYDVVAANPDTNEYITSNGTKRYHFEFVINDGRVIKEVTNELYNEAREIWKVNDLNVIHKFFINLKRRKGINETNK